VNKFIVMFVEQSIIYVPPTSQRNIFANDRWKY